MESPQLKNDKLFKNTAIIMMREKEHYKICNRVAQRRNIKIFRADVTASLSGLVDKSLEMEKIMLKNLNIKKEKNFTLVSQGLLGSKNDIIVDDVNYPKTIYGICNGQGDFIRNLNKKQTNLIQKLKKKYNIQV